MQRRETSRVGLGPEGGAGAPNVQRRVGDLAPPARAGVRRGGSERLLNADSPPVPPVFDPANFHASTVIDNSYLPMTPGDIYVYQGTPQGRGEIDSVVIT